MTAEKIAELLGEQELADIERVAAALANGWTVGESPVPNITGKYICGNTYLTWPSCIAGSGDSIRAAIDAARAAIKKEQEG